MNKENLKTLIATVEEAGKNGEFDLNHYTHECGSPACIAGYAAHLLGRGVSRSGYGPLTHREFRKSLADYLDVYMYEAHEIAEGFCDIDGINVEPRAKEAVQYLKGMLEAGRVLTWRSYFAGHGWD
jgi:hypothetical protein